MTPYLLTHNGPLGQYGIPRRNGAGPSGTVVVHTYEAPPTWSLEKAASGIAYRTDRYASYHLLAGGAGPRNVLQLAPWHAETWHETTTNNWAVGISMVTYAGNWKKLPREMADNLVDSAAFGAYLYATWLKQDRGITIPARHLTRAEAIRRKPGFIGHGEIDVGRRSDPGADFDWDRFFSTYNALMNTGGGSPALSTPSTDWLDMASQKEVEDALWNVLNRNVSIGGATAKRYGGKTAPLYSLIRDGGYALDEARDTPRRVWMYELKVGGATAKAIGKTTTNAISALRYAAGAVFDSRPRFASILNRLKG